MRFTDLTGPQVAALDPDTVAVLPLGAIEQHGPHLPVSTDWVTASSAARAAVEASGVPAVELPGLAVTKSDEHCRFPGTIWLSWDTMMRTLIDYGESLAVSGVSRLLFVNGHGGNSALGQVACRELRKRFGLRTFFSHLSVPADQGGTARDTERSGAGPSVGAPDEYGMGIHGGHGETSLMLHLRPDLVHLELAERRVPEALTTYEHIGFGKAVSFGWLTDDFGPDGYIGDPTGATAQHGKAVFDAAVGRLVEVIAEARRWPAAG